MNACAKCGHTLFVVELISEDKPIVICANHRCGEEFRGIQGKVLRWKDAETFEIG